MPKSDSSLGNSLRAQDRDKSPALGAVEEYWRSAELETRAGSVLASGCLSGLESLAAQGWRPDPAKSGWLSAALRDAGGGSAQWLAKTFPHEFAGSKFWTELREHEIDSTKWSLAAMKAAEDAGLRQAGAASWMGACLKAGDGARCVEESWRRNSFWSSPPHRMWSIEALMQIWDELELAGLERKAIEAACGWVKAVRVESPQEFAAFARASGFALMNYFVAISDPGLFDPLWEELGDDWARMDKTVLDLDMEGMALSASLEANTKLVARAGMGLSEKLGEAGPPAGLVALLGGKPAFELALSRGWISPMRVALRLKCDDLDWLAHDQERISADVGRQIDMSSRWARCLKVWSIADIDEGERERMLAKCSPRKGVAWKGGNKTREVRVLMQANPLELLLAFSDESENLYKSRVQKLCQSGASAMDALASESALGSWNRAKYAAALSGEGWLGRLLEREALEGAARVVPSGGKSKSL